MLLTIPFCLEAQIPLQSRAGGRSSEAAAAGGGGAPEDARGREEEKETVPGSGQEDAGFVFCPVWKGWGEVRDRNLTGAAAHGRLACHSEGPGPELQPSQKEQGQRMGTCLCQSLEWWKLIETCQVPFPPRVPPLALLTGAR